MQLIEKYAKENNIPIIQKEGLEILIDVIQKNKCLFILEIGSAIGYSTINMARIDSKIQIETVELDLDRFNIAKSNIERFKLSNQIKIYNVDALEFSTNRKYDLIFIDAAKAQYIKFFEKYKDNLNENGIIFSDNLSFHGYVDNPEKIKSRNLRQLVRKISSYIQFLKENKEFETVFIKNGDGIGISYKNSNK